LIGYDNAGLIISGRGRPGSFGGWGFIPYGSVELPSSPMAGGQRPPEFWEFRDLLSPGYYNKRGFQQSYSASDRFFGALGRSTAIVKRITHMEIRTRRWDDPVEPGDGARILICRYRPRALRKEDETWNAWMPHLGPSKELHAAVYGKHGTPPISWAAYRQAYLREMREQKQAITELALRVKNGETITLLCSSQCDRESRCHRAILKELIEREANISL
jgi:uncharacterized protein YeaO (DUF488 family)